MSEDHRRAEIAAARVADYVRTFVAAPCAFRGQQLRGTGPVRDFEQALAERCGFPHCMATCNATTALLVAALAIGIDGKEVICPPHSWDATFGVLEYAGARLVHAEKDEDGDICPQSVARLISSSTAAVLAADWKGKRHQADAIASVCRDHGLIYVEDTAYLPSQNSDEHSVADVQVISFGPGKPVSLGEGGALLTRSSMIYERAVALSQHPERCSAEGIKEVAGHQFLNARIHPVAAILGIELLNGACES